MKDIIFKTTMLKGEKGDKGEQGDVSITQLNNALAPFNVVYNYASDTSLTSDKLTFEKILDDIRTRADGTYIFRGIRPGTYFGGIIWKVSSNVQEGYGFSTQNNASYFMSYNNAVKTVYSLNRTNV